MEENQNQSLLELEVDQEAGTNITEMAKWAKLFAVLVSSIIGMIVLLFILARKTLITNLSAFTEMDNGDQAVSAMMAIFSVILLFFIAICVVILVYMFKGVNGLKA